MNPSTLSELCSHYNAVCVRKAQLGGDLEWRGGDTAARRNLRICKARYAEACRRWPAGPKAAKQAVKLCS
jgi:hypothetical protein